MYLILHTQFNEFPMDDFDLLYLISTDFKTQYQEEVYSPDQITDSIRSKIKNSIVVGFNLNFDRPFLEKHKIYFGDTFCLYKYYQKLHFGRSLYELCNRYELAYDYNNIHKSIYMLAQLVSQKICISELIKFYRETKRLISDHLCKD